MAAKAPISAIILTWNEARNLPRCLDSLQWVDEVHVLDSFSTDDTPKIAKEKGAHFYQRVFDHYSAQRNWALANIPFKNEWLLWLDADEQVPPELEAEIGEAIINPGNHVAYYLARKNTWWGHWAKHGGWFPNWKIQLMKRNAGQYETRIVHEHLSLNGTSGYLKTPLINEDRKGIEAYFDRHNRYSSMEAVEMYRVLNAQELVKSAGARWGGNAPERRRYLKNLAYRHLPLRPLFKFLWMYFWKWGVLDGRIGFRYSVLYSFYEYQINLKMEELSEPGSPLQEKYQQCLKPS